MESINQLARIEFSVICATIDKAALVEQSVNSIRDAAIAGGVHVEVIVIDQSMKKDCEILQGKFDKIDFVFVHSQVRGLALSRNRGLDLATGDYVMFWDADCLMDRDFFREFREASILYPEAKLIYGTVKCPTSGVNVFRNWSDDAAKVSQFKRWQISTSVNCVWRNDSANRLARMDERFGIGSTYGSCEDVDFFISLQGPAFYFPRLRVYHPKQHVQEVPLSKSKAYSFGFGALCRKHTFRYGALYLSLTTVKKVVEVIRGRVRFSTAMTLVFERIRGYLAFAS